MAIELNETLIYATTNTLTGLNTIGVQAPKETPTRTIIKN